MLGNVAEYTADTLSSGDMLKIGFDPLLIHLGPYSLVRGGSYRTPLSHVRAASRNYVAPFYDDNDVGLRVARSLATVDLITGGIQAALPRPRVKEAVERKGPMRGSRGVTYEKEL